MRVLVIGQGPFGGDCLKALLDAGEDIIGVITTPDEPGAKRPNPLKELAQGKMLPLLQPDHPKGQPHRLEGGEVFDFVAGLNPELLVLVFVTDFVPQKVIDLASKGGINYHPSLLPAYRGGSAINWAVISGEKETGVTVHFIDSGVDTGDIILQESVPIQPDENVASLYFNKLYPLGVRLIPEAVRLLREGLENRIPQDETKASFQPMIKEEHVVIDWQVSGERIHNLIRGANPNPGATTTLDGQKLKIWEATFQRDVNFPGSPGEVVALVESEGIMIAVPDGNILVKRIQLAGQGKQAAADFIAAGNLQGGKVLGH